MMAFPTTNLTSQAGVVAPQLRVSGSMVVSENKYESGSMYVKWVIVMTIQNKPASNSPLFSAQNNSGGNSHPEEEEEKRKIRERACMYLACVRPNVTVTWCPVNRCHIRL